MKPTFKRREPREFKNTNNEDDIRPSYDFKVSYKTSYDEKDENGNPKERRHRDQKDKGVPLDTFNKKTADDDDEFTFVTGKQKRAPRKQDDDSDEEKTDGFNRGAMSGAGGGRGGFFKNSKKAE